MGMHMSTSMRQAEAIRFWSNLGHPLESVPGDAKVVAKAAGLKIKRSRKHPPRPLAERRKASEDRLAIKLKFIEAHGSECVDCHLAPHHAVLEFDHIDASTKIDGVFGVLYRLGWEAAHLEAAKCELVCRNCHAIRTWNRNAARLNG